MSNVERIGRIKTRLPISSSKNQLKSVSLGTNEEFARLHNELTEFVLSLEQRLRNDPLFSLHCAESHIYTVLGVFTKILLKKIWIIDKLIKRAEKNAQLREILAGIIFLIERTIIPDLREAILFHQKRKYSFVWDHPQSVRSRILLTEQAIRLEGLVPLFTNSAASGLESAYNVVVSAVILLSFVYQYLIGCVDKGGAKTYSSGSFEFRDTFVPIVLFQGAYVWIKFRQASCPASRRKRKSCQPLDHAAQFGDESHVPEGVHEGVYRRPMKDKFGTITHYKYEPRFKPPRERLESGTTLKFNCLSLGQYNTHHEAKIVRQIAAFFYGKEDGRTVQLEDGRRFSIPSMSEQEESLSGMEKAKWATRKTKEVYADLLKQKARQLGQFENTAAQTSSHFGDARHSDPSPSVELDAFSAAGTYNTANELTCFTASHGGNGAEQLTAPESNNSLLESIPAADLFSDLFSGYDSEQLIESRKKNDVPTVDDRVKVAGDCSEIACACGLESIPVASQSSAFDIPSTAIVARLPHLDGGAQGLELIEPQFSPATVITFEQMELVPEQVQLEEQVTCQKKHLEDIAGWNVELQQKLRESEMQKSELQQKLRESEVQKSELQRENEHFKAMFQRVAELISTCNVVGNRP